MRSRRRRSRSRSRRGRAQHCSEASCPVVFFDVASCCRSLLERLGHLAMRYMRTVGQCEGWKWDSIYGSDIVVLPELVYRIHVLRA